MDKKEFLSFSLPYGLKGIDAMGDIAELIIFDKNGYFGTDLDIEEDAEELSNLDGNFLPILRPLSDLTKPIEHNGEKFVPIVFLAKMRSAYLHESDFDRYYGKLKMDISTKRLPFDMFQKLVEWKFNLMDESEEFIDVNTLQENPYK